jgi:hypothetical protein
MSVIGRLDEQVEEKLIKPVSKKRGADDAPMNSPPPQDTPTEEVEEAAALDENVAQRDELPVWLL